MVELTGSRRETAGPVRFALGFLIVWLGLLAALLPLPVTASAVSIVHARCQIVDPLLLSGDEGSTTLNWTTARELGVVGFDLLQWEEESASWAAVNKALIAASNSPAGAAYRLPINRKPAALSSPWVLRVWTEDATLEDHRLQLMTGWIPTQVTPDTHRKPTAVPPGKTVPNRHPVLSAMSDNGSLPVVTTVDVHTSLAGIHFIRVVDLASTFQLPVEEVIQRVEQGRLAFRQQGVRVPYWGDVSTGGLYFFAPRLESLFFAGNVTQLSFEPAPLWMEARTVPSGLQKEADHGQSRMTRERNLQPVPTLPGNAESDFWVWDSFLGGHPSLGARTYTFDLTGLAAAEGNARVEVWINTVSEVESVFSVELNGRGLGSQTWSGRQRRILGFDAEPAWLNEGSNTLRIVSSGNRISLGYLDRFTLEFPRRLQPTNGPILFSATDSKVLEASGPSGKIVEVWDVTSPSRPIRLERTDPDPGPEILRFDAMPGREYVTFLRDAVISPDRMVAFGPDTLRDPGNRAEYLAVTPGWLAQATEALAARRTAQGLSSRVVRLEDIHHSFGHGIPTPTAMASFIAHARSTWAIPPRYLMIVGDGTYDYQGYLGQSDNLVPPLILSTLFGRVVSDVLFGDLDKDGRPEVAVGRLPVRNEQELLRLIAQMDGFGSRTVENPRALILADRPDAGGDFIRNGEELGSILEAGFEVDRIFNAAMETSEVRAELFGKLPTGLSLFNYVGHGGRDRFGNGYLTVTDAETLDFGSGQPLVVAITCAAGQFGLPGTPCLGEALLLKTGRAPIAVWSPSGFSIDFQLHPLNRLLMKELTRQPMGARLGDILLRVVTQFRDQGGDATSAGLYNLLGDPALPMNFGVQPPILAAAIAEGSVRLRLSGIPEATYEVTVADRLDRVEWQALATVSTDASGEGGFDVMTLPGDGQRFYRARYRP